jgi:hypothetical protein
MEDHMKGHIGNHMNEEEEDQPEPHKGKPRKEKRHVKQPETQTRTETEEAQHETQTKKKRRLSKVEAWSQGEPGFWRWMQDIKPRVLHRSNRYEVFEPTERQREIIRAVFERKPSGGESSGGKDSAAALSCPSCPATDGPGVDGDDRELAHSIIMNVEPRRHGKSACFAVLVLYFFTTLKNSKVWLLGASEDHCRRTMFKTLEGIILNTPRLARMVPRDKILGFSISLPARGNVIQYSATDLRSGFGDRISILWVSDWHAHLDLTTFAALQASLLDSKDSLIFIDSNTDSLDGHVHILQKAAAEDPAIASFETEYRDLEDYAARAPAWIDRGRARQLARTSLPEAFGRDILGKRSSVVNALFPKAVIEACRRQYRVPVMDVQAIARGRAYRVGIGLDRSKGLIAAGRNDATVLTATAKIATPGGEAEYVILDQRKFLINTAKAIKAAILEIRDKYGIDAGVFEQTEVSDLHVWALEEGLPIELISPTESVQTILFPELHRLAKEGRLQFSEQLTDLESEMGTFIYTRRKGGGYTFSHSSARTHDDTIYSLAWSVYSLRRAVLAAYELGSIACVNRTGGRRAVCYLLGGGLQLLCTEKCAAHAQVKAMYDEFRRFDIESELTLAEFFKTYVKVSGAVIYQAI